MRTLRAFPKAATTSILGLINRYTKHHDTKRDQVNPLISSKRDIADHLRMTGEEYIEHGGLRYRLPKHDCTTLDVRAFAEDFPELFAQYQVPLKQDLIIEKIK